MYVEPGVQRLLVSACLFEYCSARDIALLHTEAEFRAHGLSINPFISPRYRFACRRVRLATSSICARHLAFGICCALGVAAPAINVSGNRSNKSDFIAILS